MAEFVYKSTIYGPQVFTVADEGGIVEFKGKKLNSFGGYLTQGTQKNALRANATSLESVARVWWKKRTDYLNVLGHNANGVEP